MDSTTSTLLAALDARLTALEASSKVKANLLDDLEARLEKVEEVDLDRLEDAVSELTRDIDGALSRLDEVT